TIIRSVSLINRQHCQALIWQENRYIDKNSRSVAIGNNRWTAWLISASMGCMALPRMPLTTASAVTFLYALGYPIGALAVAAMSPMAALVLRFSLAASILAVWTVLAKAPWPRGAQLGHVVVTGLLIQAVQFCCLYEALQLGAPAVLGAVAIAMNP